MQKLTRRKFIKKGLLLVGGAVLFSPVPLQRYAISVNRYRIHLENLPMEFDGFRILHFTDLHHGELLPISMVKHIIRMANNVKADVIACTGDYVVKSKTTSELIPVWKELSELQAKDGVFAVLGNHDHWADRELCLDLLENSGISLRHRSLSVERNDKKIWFTGAGDLWEDDFGVNSALKDVPDTDVKILLAHNPDTADINFDKHFDLVLSGHTHGGQVKLPFLGYPFIPVNNKIYSQGLIDNGRCKVFISRGIGCSSVPVRFNCYPELALLELKSSWV